MNGNQSPEAAPRLPQLCAITVGGIALLALAGWQLNARFLAGQWDSYVPMAPSTALAFLLLAGALFCFARWPSQRASRLLALAAVIFVSLLGVLVLAQFITGIDWGVEQALSGTNELLGSTPLGRMSPLTAVAFLLESSAFLILLIAPRRRNAPAAALLAAGATAINAVVLIGYAYGAPLLYGGPVVPTALPTAAAFVLVGVGQINLAEPDISALQAWNKDSMRGRLLRAFLPSLLVLLLIEGWLEVRIEPFLSPNRALWHSLTALTAGALIVTITGWIAGRTGDGIEQAQAALRESEARYRLLFEQNPLPMWVYDTATLRFLAVNAAAIGHYGYERDEFLAMTIKEIRPPEELPLLQDTLAKTRQPQERSGPWKHRKKDGTLIDVEIISHDTMFLDRPAWLVLANDITERKRAEAAFAASEKRFRALVENAPDAISLIGADGTVVYDSPAAPQLLGYETGELLGRNAFALIHPDDLPRITSLFQQLLQNPSTRVNSLFRFQHKDGSWTWIEAVASNLLAEPSVQAVVINYRDITERKRAEEALRLSEEKYRTLVDEVNDGFYVTDSAGVFTFANPALARMYSVESSQALVGRKFSDSVAPEVPAELGEAYRSAMQTGRAPEVINGQIVRPDGTLTFIEVKPALIVKGGQIVGSRGVVRDVTERKRAEEALQASKLITEGIINAIPVRVFWKDKNLVYLGCNTAFARDAGFTDPKDVIGKDDYQMGWRDQAELYRGDDRQVIESGSSKLHIEEPQTTPEGNTITLLTSKVPLRSYKGEVSGVLGTYMDITVRKQAEEQLSEALIFNQTIIDASPIGIITYKASGEAVSANEALARIIGATVEQVRAQNFREIESWKRSGLLAAAEAALASGITQNLDVRVITTFGKDVWLSSRFAPFHYHGEPHLLGIFTDVTERKQREFELEAVNRISTALRAAETLDEMLPRLLAETTTILGGSAGSIWLYDPVRDEVRLAFEQGWGVRPAPVKRGEGIPGHVVATGQPYMSREIRTDPQLHEAVRHLVPSGRGGACVPIHATNEIIGGLYVNTDLPREFTAADVHVLTTLAEIAGNAIQRMRLHEETVRQVERLRALHDIDLAITASMDLRMTLNVLLQQVTRQLNVDAAIVLLLNPYRQTLEYSAGRGFRTKAFENAQLRLGEGYAGRAALERHFVHVPNLADQHDHPRLAKHLAAEALVAYYGVPLIAKGEVKGVLEIFHRSPLDLAPEWLSFLETLGSQAAIAIDNAQLFDNVQRSNLDLTLAYDATIEGWSRALDLRDRETEGHTQRVTEMTLRLARALGLSDAEFVHVRRGALLHDIGKMGVPDAILLKPGPLTDDEWKVMRLHPKLAYDMLAPIAYLKPALDIPYCHHEKWDGGGYPRGLKGEQIPLAARLFAVVDVWDALRSDRPYRKGWPADDVEAYLREQAGKHFDPQAVEAFLKLAEADRSGTA